MNARADTTVAAPAAVSRDESRAVFGQVMGFVALTLGFVTLGAYIGRDLSGGWGILAFIAGFGCIVGLNVASARGNEQVAIPNDFVVPYYLDITTGAVIDGPATEALAPTTWRRSTATSKSEPDPSWTRKRQGGPYEQHR